MSLMSSFRRSRRSTRAEKRKHEAAIKRSAELEAAALESKPNWPMAPPGLPSGRGSRPDRSRTCLRAITVVVGCNLVPCLVARSNTVPVTGFSYKG